MKVLHVTFADSGGGAARAAYRLHCAERAHGLASEMVVMHKDTSDVDVHRTGEWFPGRNHVACRLQRRLLRAFPGGPRSERSINIFPSRLHKRINTSGADVVNLHWINEEMISVPEVAGIQKPLVWTMHDAWACSGTAHYPENGGVPRRGFELERWAQRRKQRHWRELPVVLVSPSNWLAGVAERSEVFGHRPVHVIPNPIMPGEFRPHDRLEARRRFDFDERATLLLFGAHDVGHPRKGVASLLRALEACAGDKTIDRLELVVFGGGELPSMPVPVRRVGWVSNDLAQLYSAADVFLAPSLIDNLPNTVAEAAACGLPTVAFRVGGLPDLVAHMASGYLATPFEAADFAAGIRWVLDQPRAALATALAERARALAPDTVVEAYLSAYREAIAAGRGR